MDYVSKLQEIKNSKKELTNMQLVNRVLPEVAVPIHCNSKFLLSKIPKNKIRIRQK